MHRRSKDDVQWQQVKAEADIRDNKQCRFLAILLPNEMDALKKLNPPTWMLIQIDHAHVKPVGMFLNDAYNVDNVYCLCRWAHTHLDNLIDPLTNNCMDTNKQWYWWTRIRFKKTFQYDCNINYDELYNDMAELNVENNKKGVMSWW